MVGFLIGSVGAIRAARTDGHWIPHNRGLVGANVVGVGLDAMTPATVYALTRYHGVFKSTDGGATWVEKNRGLPEDKTVKWGHLYANLLTIDPHDSMTLYVPIQGRIYKSTDGAEHWVESSRGTSFPQCGLNGDNIAGVLVDPQDSWHVFAGTIASGCDGGLFESTDGGLSWEQIAGSNLRRSGLGNDAWALAIDPIRRRRLYVASIKNAFLYSQVGGVAWTRLTPPGAAPFSRAVAVDPRSPERIFLGNGNGLFILRSGRFAVAGVEEHHFPGQDIWSIQFAVARPDIVYLTAGAGGLYTSSDGGRTWHWLGHGDLFPQTVVVHPADPDIVYLGSAGTGIHQSLDGGRAFVVRDEGLPFAAQIQTLVRHPLNPRILYAGVFANGLYRSEDGGHTWVKWSADMHVANGFHLTIDPQNPDILYGGDRAIKKSTDGGRTWREILHPPGALFRSFALDPHHPETLFAVDSATLTMYKSTDGGETWAVKESYAPISFVRVAERVVVDPTDSRRVYAASYDFFWRSTDGGETWQRITRGLQSVFLDRWIDSITVDSVTPNVIYITTRSNRVFTSTDFGETWQRTGFNVGQYPGRITLDVRDHRTLYLATPSRWFRSTDGGETWMALSVEGLPPGDIFQAKFVGVIQDLSAPGRFYAGTQRSGVLVFEPTP